MGWGLGVSISRWCRWLILLHPVLFRHNEVHPARQCLQIVLWHVEELLVDTWSKWVREPIQRLKMTVIIDKFLYMWSSISLHAQLLLLMQRSKHVVLDESRCCLRVMNPSCHWRNELRCSNGTFTCRVDHLLSWWASGWRLINLINGFYKEMLCQRNYIPKLRWQV